MISVVIPLYNKERAISKTISSVLAQTYINFELIIIDDGSTDKSLDAVSLFLDKRIRLISQKNSGVSAARNRGVKEAIGEWIVFLDADDILLPYCLHILISIVERHKVKIGVANFYLFDQIGYMYKYVNSRKQGVVKNAFRYWFFENFFLRMGNSIYDRELLLQHPFNTNLQRYEDFEALFNLIRNSEIVISQIPVLIYTFEFGDLARNFSDINKDFICHLDFKHKSFWEKINLALLYAQGLKVYRKDKKKLQDKYKRYNIYMYLAKLMNLWIRLKRKYFGVKNRVSVFNIFLCTLYAISCFFTVNNL